MDLIGQSAAKREFKLTSDQIRMIGEPDKLAPNPRCESRPIRLYSRERILAWLEQQLRFRKYRRH
jgi:hypothetical protein